MCQATGTARPSFTQEMLEKGDLSAEEESIIKWAAAAIYGGGADSTVSVAYSFFLAMLLYPDVQKKDQEEGSVTNSLAMLTAIPEVDLGMEYVFSAAPRLVLAVYTLHAVLV